MKSPLAVIAHIVPAHRRVCSGARAAVGLSSVWALAMVFTAGLSLSGAVGAQSDNEMSYTGDAQSERSAYPGLLSPQAPLSLPDSRPKLTLSLPLTGRLLGLNEPVTDDIGAQDADRVSWSLEAWQLNTASLAHIQCSQHRLTLESFVAQNCQFVDQPVPQDAVNLVQIQGQWTAAPNVNVGVGLFRSDNTESPLSAQLGQPIDQVANIFGLPSQAAPAPAGVVDGVSANVSFGIEVERVGDFLLGLQLARYRQRTSLMDLGNPMGWAQGGALEQVSYAAELNLGWQRGNFRGDLSGRYANRPIRLGQLNGETLNTPPNGFDLEFSWQPGSASLSVGVSNVLDGGSGSSTSELVTEEGPRDIYGRIPYVRYKQDL